MSITAEALQQDMNALEEALESFTDDSVDVCIMLKNHENVPSGFVSEQNVVSSDSETYTKVIEAKDGMTKKSIRLVIPD